MAVSKSKVLFRLPTKVKPQRYFISLAPDLQTLTFEGNVCIVINVTQRTREIVLHSVDLDLDNVLLEDNCQQILTPEYVIIEKENEIAKIVFSKPIVFGIYKLKMTIEGVISNKLQGLYYSHYVNQTGELLRTAVTQFEPSYARRCFPCWDEPAFKAIFDITLTVDRNLLAISNMPVRSKRKASKTMVTYEFESTPPMSTYIVAFVIGDYEFEEKLSDGILIRVYTPKGKINEALCALEIAVKILPFFRKYFNIPFPLPKVDLVAISDCVGAMENWGLITYRDTGLLVDPSSTTMAITQWLHLIISHELVHQWLGNLVTFDWWNHLWINEGFAQFAERLCVDYFFPEFGLWDQFVIQTCSNTMKLDTLKNSHAIETCIKVDSDLGNMFDEIIYNKGAAIMRMLQSYVGENKFKEAINMYLTRYKYQTTSEVELWKTFEFVTSKPVSSVMSTWSRQKGYPLVSITAEPDCYCKGLRGLTILLTQEPFGTNKLDKNNIWKIPLTISTGRAPGEACIHELFETKELRLHIADIQPKEWIKLNPGYAGYYRVKYCPNLLSRLIPALHNKTIPPIDRVSILLDLLALAQTGRTDTVELLKILEGFYEEHVYIVWSAISKILNKISTLLIDSAQENDFIKFQKKLLHKVAQRINWESTPGESPEDVLLRSLIFERLAWIGDEVTILEARERFKTHLEESQIPADLRIACYRAVIKSGGQDEFNAFLEIYKASDLNAEKERIIKSLNATEDPGILKQAFNFAMSDEARNQDAIIFVMSLSISHTGRDIAWEFFKNNFNELLKRCENGNILAKLVRTITEKFASEPMALEVETFFNNNRQLDDSSSGISSTSMMTINQSVEMIRLNVAWLERDFDYIKKFLDF